MAIFAVSFLFQLATGKSSPPTAHRGRRDAKKKRVECCGIPLKPKPGLTPISCHAALERSACAPFIKERRMECINAKSLRRKSGQMGHPACVAGVAKLWPFQPERARVSCYAVLADGHASCP